MRDYNLYLNDIIRAIERIENSMNNVSKEDFYKNVDIQDAILMRINVIWEAVKSIPDDLKEKYKNIEWKKISGMRDIISHVYFGIDFDIIWYVIKNKLRILKKEIKLILDSGAKGFWYFIFVSNTLKFKVQNTNRIIKIDTENGKIIGDVYSRDRGCGVSREITPTYLTY